MKAERMILSDAIDTAIETEKENAVLRKMNIVLSILLAATSFCLLRR